MFQDQHAALPTATHDEFAREEFCSSLRKMFTTELFPGGADVYYKHQLPAFEAKHGRPPKSPQEVKKVTDESFYFRGANVVGRAVQELVWDTVGESIERQLDDLNARAKPKADDLGTLRLNPDMKMPKYIDAVDIHVMPGNFQTEIAEDDVYAGALYDRGVHVFAFGGLGKQNEGLGVAQAALIRERFPDFKPKRILDVGCGPGFTTLPGKSISPTRRSMASTSARPRCATPTPAPKPWASKRTSASRTEPTPTSRTGISIWWRPCWSPTNARCR